MIQAAASAARRRATARWGAPDALSIEWSIGISRCVLEGKLPGNDGSATDGDLASAKHQFQVVAD
jgi:hypothetical protein